MLCLITGSLRLAAAVMVVFSLAIVLLHSLRAWFGSRSDQAAIGGQVFPAWNSSKRFFPGTVLPLEGDMTCAVQVSSSRVCRSLCRPI